MQEFIYVELHDDEGHTLRVEDLQYFPSKLEEDQSLTYDQGNKMSLLLGHVADKNGNRMDFFCIQRFRKKG